MGCSSVYTGASPSRGTSQLITFSDDSYFEKRRVFLKSYQFCKKTTVADRIKASFIRVTKRLVILFRLHCSRKFYLRIRCRWYGRRRSHSLFPSKSRKGFDWCRTRRATSCYW